MPLTLQTVFLIFYLYLSSLTDGQLPEKDRRLLINDIVPTEYDNLKTPRVQIYSHTSKLPYVGYIGDGPAEVALTIVIMNVRNVDVSEMSIRFDVMLTKRWADERLIYPSFSKEEKVVLDIEWRRNIWMPDIFFENSIEGHVQSTIIPNMYLWLFRNKTIQFTARLSIEFSCHMDLRLFPHDTQECEMIIMSLAHTDDEMQLVWNKYQNVTRGDNIVLPQFEIIKVASSDCRKDARFSCLKGSVTMTRRSGYYITNVYVPTSLVVWMSMLTFWIPPDAVPARVTLGVTSLLTIVTKQYQASLPNVSYIVALNIWLSACIAFVFVSLLEYATVIALHTRRKKSPKNSALTIHDPVRAVHKVYPREMRLVRNGWNGSNGSHKRSKKRSTWENQFAKLTPENIDYVSRILFPCAFISQCSIYWAVYYT